MTTETTEPKEYPVVSYDITEAGVAELRKKYEGLTIQGPNDKGGLALVHTGRIEIRDIRVAIEKRRKQYNSGALDFTRTVNAKAKEATAPLLPLEASLKAEEDRIKAEIAKIKAAKIKEEEDRLQRRVDLLQRFGKQLSIVNLKAMSDDEFQVVYDKAKAEHEEEQARLAKEAEEKAAQEEADRKEKEALEEADRVEREAKEEEDRKEREAEEARLAGQRAEQDRVAKEQEAKEEELRLEKERIDKEQAENEAEIQAENDRLEAERQAIENDKKIEDAKKEAAEKATKEAEEKAKREAEEKEEADRKAKEEEIRQEALKPDKEKLWAYVVALSQIPTPKLKTNKAKAILAKAKEALSDMAATVRDSIDEM